MVVYDPRLWHWVGNDLFSPLFPEKEILLILAETDRSAAIFKALKECDCIIQPGGGIAFSIAVEDIVWLEKGLE